MFHSDKKPFEGKKKSPWNKGISEKNNKKTKKIKKKIKKNKKIFYPQRKEVLNNYYIGESWFHHKEELWNFERSRI